MRLLLLFILLLTTSLISSQDILIYDDTAVILDDIDEDYVNYSSEEYDDMLIAVRELAMELDELRNRTVSKILDLIIN